MQKRASLLIAVLAVATASVAQNVSNIGFSIGGVSYQGDLIEPVVSLLQARPAVAFHYNYTYIKELTLSGTLRYGRLQGDETAFDVPFRKERALRFTANMLEATVGVEYHFLGRYGGLYRYGVFDKNWSPYVGLSTGVVYTFGRSLSTETGQVRTELPEPGGRDWFFTAPVRVGVLYNYAPGLAFVLEASSHPVFSDQFDGVSLNGRSDTNDWYAHASIGVYWGIGRRQLK